MEINKEYKAFRIFLLIMLALMGISVIASADFPNPGLWPPTPYNLDVNYYNINPPSVRLTWDCAPFENGGFIMARRELPSGNWNQISTDDNPTYSDCHWYIDNGVDGVHNYEYGVWSYYSTFPYYWSLTYAGGAVANAPNSSPTILPYATWVDCGSPNAIQNNPHDSNPNSYWNGEIGSEYINRHHFAYYYNESPYYSYIYGTPNEGGEYLTAYILVEWIDANGQIVYPFSWTQQCENYSTSMPVIMGQWQQQYDDNDPNTQDLCIINDTYGVVNAYPKQTIINLLPTHPLPWTVSQYAIYDQEIWLIDQEDGVSIIPCWATTKYFEAHCDINCNYSWYVDNIYGQIDL